MPIGKNTLFPSSERPTMYTSERCHRWRWRESAEGFVIVLLQRLLQMLLRMFQEMPRSTFHNVARSASHESLATGRNLRWT
jgi:hypothetical protein